MEKTPLQQGVAVETVLLPIQAGVVYLAPVLEEDEEELRRSLQDEIGAGALTLVPRERSLLPTYASSTGITLLTLFPDFRSLLMSLLTT